MREVWLVAIHGIGTGAVFGLIAMSLNVIYSSSDIWNFAQGYWVVVSGLLAFTWMPSAPVGVGPWLLWMVVIAVVVAALMAIQGLLTLAPLRSSVEQHSWLVTTLAASVIIGGVVLQIQGPDAIAVPTPLPTFSIGGITTSTVYLAAIALMLLVFVALRLFATRTRIGLAIQALRQDLEASAAAGIPVRSLQLLSFGISGVILGLTGTIAGPVLALADVRGVELVMMGFTAAVVGGLGNLTGALVAGPLLGVVSVSTAIWIGGDFQRTVVLAVLILILLFRPEGLFGRVTARRV